MKPSISKLVQKSLTLFSCHFFLSFNSSVSCHLCWNPTTFQDLNSLQHFSMPLGAHRFQLAHNSLASVPFFASHIPNTFCTISEPLPACRFFLPGHGFPNVVFSIFPHFLTRILVRNIFLASSTYHTRIFVCFRTPLCSMLRSLTLLVNENPLFFRFRLEFFTIFPFLKQWKLAAYCKATYTSSLSCCIASVLASAINPSSSIAPAFANSSAISLPSVTNLSYCVICSFSFFVRCAFQVPLPPRCLFLPVHAILPQY